jgi:hypothetical protein
MIRGWHLATGDLLECLYPIDFNSLTCSENNDFFPAKICQQPVTNCRLQYEQIYTTQTELHKSPELIYYQRHTNLSQNILKKVTFSCRDFRICSLLQQKTKTSDEF